MQPAVDLVADIGEGFGAFRMGDDEALLGLVTSANIACGFHAGDPRIMDVSTRECVRRGISIGAHPSFPDLIGFGRRTMELTAEEVRTDILYQLGALHAFSVANKGRLAHVAPHGRLGNLVAVRADYASAVVSAICDFDARLIVVAQAGCLHDIALDHGLSVATVGIADRNYQDDGTLVPRSDPSALVTDEDAIARRTVTMVTEGIIETVAGSWIQVPCDTVLLHGDTPGAVSIARRIRVELEAAGVRFAPLEEVLALKQE